eukprot:tig00021680_g23039.t1
MLAARLRSSSCRAMSACRFSSSSAAASDSPGGDRGLRLKFGEALVLKDRKGREWEVPELKPGASFQWSRGFITHEDIVATEIGGYVSARRGRAKRDAAAAAEGEGEEGEKKKQKEVRMQLYRPTLASFVTSMKRGPTVAYPKDAGAMCQLLDLEPGQTVLEAGSGSGGLTLYLSRAVGPSGRVLSFEARPEFSVVAQANLRKWVKAREGRDVSNVEFRVGDLAAAWDGPEPALGTPDEAAFDAIALDMMEPWKVLGSACRALRSGGLLVAYTPNITQVVHLIEFNDEEGHPLRLERVMEVEHREWDVRPPVCHPTFFPKGHTAFLSLFRRRAGPGRGPRAARAAAGAEDPDEDEEGEEGGDAEAERGERGPGVQPHR